MSKLQKALSNASYEEVVVALDEPSKLQMLKETIETLESIEENIDNRSRQGSI